MNRAVPDGRLVLPPLPPRHISRRRLLAALDDATQRPLTLLAAGPGSGKSVLLTDWAMTLPTRAAWVSLDRGDDEPNRFWAAVVAALRVAEVCSEPVVTGKPGLGNVLKPFLPSAGEPPLVVILDDAHVLTHRDVLSGLEDTIERFGGRLRLVIAARSDPLLPLHRYRLSGELSELRAADLAMTDEEATALLAAHGVHLPKRDFDVLAARTEGWTAGMRLSAMSLEGVDRPSEFVTEFALDHGSIGEYLMDEVLERQPGPIRQLLIETSFLDVVTGPLAEAVTGLDDAAAMLAELSRTNSFVVPLDRTTGSYRYHQLLAEILRYLLHREPPERRAELIGRAARWHQASGNLGRALRFSAEGKDWRYIAHTLTYGGFGQALVERIDLTSLPVEALLHEVVDDTDELIELVATAAALLAYGGRHEQARVQLDRLGAMIGTTINDDELATTVALTELLIARARNDVRSADRWVAELAALSRCGDLDAAIAFEQATTHFYGRAHESVEGLLRMAAAKARAASRPALELDCLAQLAHVNAFWGRFKTSRADERKANAVLVRNPTLAAPTTLLVAAAERALAKAEFGPAHEAVRGADTMPVADRDHDLQAEIRMLQTLLYTSTGQFVEARRAMIAMAEPPAGLMGDYQMACVAGAETALGRPNAAVRLLDPHQSGTHAPVTSVALGRAHLARGDLARASAALRPILTASGPPSVRIELIDALITDAQIAQAQGNDDRRAVESLVRAIELADGEFVLPFVRAGDDLAELRKRHPQLTDQWPLPNNADFDPSDLEAGDEVAGGAVNEQLTDRERAVLRWLATTMSTNEIADELCLSVNTVKTHIAAIYRKLATAKRRDAVLRARELELL